MEVVGVRGSSWATSRWSCTSRRDQRVCPRVTQVETRCSRKKRFDICESCTARSWQSLLCSLHAPSPPMHHTEMNMQARHSLTCTLLHPFGIHHEREQACTHSCAQLFSTFTRNVQSRQAMDDAERPAWARHLPSRSTRARPSATRSAVLRDDKQGR
jgi:hypothetical protein